MQTLTVARVQVQSGPDWTDLSGQAPRLKTVCCLTRNPVTEYNTHITIRGTGGCLCGHMERGEFISEVTDATALALCAQDSQASLVLGKFSFFDQAMTSRPWPGIGGLCHRAGWLRLRTHFRFRRFDRSLARGILGKGE